jgi:hypothetical protein
LLYQASLHRDKFSALLGLWVKELGTKTDSQGKKTFDQKLGAKKLLNKTYHTQEHRTVAIELCSIGSLDHNPGNAPDSMSPFDETFSKSFGGLGQVKTSSRQVKTRKRTTAESSLSKPSRSFDGTFSKSSQDRDGRVTHLNAADITNTEKTR